ncbi:MAG: hypothetical protein QNJ45_06355 [Ardenticatenaceae bacterium]|nr:hypothetical protein [Ardenticatenaceae bacterium]
MADIQSAWNAYLQGNVIQAQQIATALAKANPDDAEAWYVLSQTLEGDRADLFHRKALSLDPDVETSFTSQAAETISANGMEEVLDEPSYEGDTVPTTFLDPSAEDTVGEERVGEPDAVMDEDTPAEFFAVPDVRPKVPPLAETAAEPAKEEAKPAVRQRSGNNALNTVALLIVGILIVFVLYLLISSLL